MAAVPALICSPLVNLFSVSSDLSPGPRCCGKFVGIETVHVILFCPEPWSLGTHRTVVEICSAQVSAPPKLPTPIEERGKDGFS